MSDHNIPTKPRMPGKYVLTKDDKEYIKSFAVNGVIPFNEYIRAVHKVLNK